MAIEHAEDDVPMEEVLTEESEQYLYNAWLPVAQESRTEKHRFHEVVSLLQLTWKPHDLDTRFATLKWIPVISMYVLSFVFCSFLPSFFTCLLVPLHSSHAPSQNSNCKQSQNSDCEQSQFWPPHPSWLWLHKQLIHHNSHCIHQPVVVMILSEFSSATSCLGSTDLSSSINSSCYVFKGVVIVEHEKLGCSHLPVAICLALDQSLTIEAYVFLLKEHNFLASNIFIDIGLTTHVIELSLLLPDGHSLLNPRSCIISQRYYYCVL